MQITVNTHPFVNLPCIQVFLNGEAYTDAPVSGVDLEQGEITCPIGRWRDEKRLVFIVEAEDAVKTIQGNVELRIKADSWMPPGETPESIIEAIKQAAVQQKEVV